MISVLEGEKNGRRGPGLLLTAAPGSLTLSLLLSSLREICMLDSAVCDDLLNTVWVCWIMNAWLLLLDAAVPAAHNCNSVIAAAASSLEILRSL